MEKVCLVIGAGAGIGGTVAKRFAKEGDRNSGHLRSTAE